MPPPPLLWLASPTHHNSKSNNFERRLADLVTSLTHTGSPSHRQTPSPRRRQPPTPRQSPSPNGRPLCWYHEHFGQAAQKCRPPCSMSGNDQSLAATSVTGQPTSRLFYVTDKSTGTRFLVDTGAEVSVLPPSHTEWCRQADHLTLQAINNTSIPHTGNTVLHWILDYVGPAGGHGRCPDVRIGVGGTYAHAQIVRGPGRAAEERQLLAVQLLIYSHTRLPVCWDISGCVLLVDTFVREVSCDLPAMWFLPRRSC